jgi:hypothetical protein
MTLRAIQRLTELFASGKVTEYWEDKNEQGDR